MTRERFSKRLTWDISNYTSTVNCSIIITFVDNDPELPKVLAESTSKPILAVPRTKTLYKAILATQSVVAVMETANTGAVNAALAAGQILALSDAELSARLKKKFDELRS